jgi:hypothetical protein
MHQFREPLASDADGYGAAVGWVAIARNPGASFESIEDAGNRGWMKPGALYQGARAERAVTGDEVKAIEVDMPEIKVCADVMVEQGQLDAQLAH